MFKWNKKEIIEYMDSKDPDRLFKIKLIPKKRTLPQNGKTHVLFHMIADKIWMDEEAVKKNMMKACFWTRRVEMKTHKDTYYFEEAIEPSTKNLTIQQNIKLIEYCILFLESLWVKVDNEDEKRFLEYYDSYIF